MEDFSVLLQKVMEATGRDEEGDLLLLRSITALSACLGRVYGIYDGRRDYSRLFFVYYPDPRPGRGG